MTNRRAIVHLPDGTVIERKIGTHSVLGNMIPRVRYDNWWIYPMYLVQQDGPGLKITLVPPADGKEIMCLPGARDAIYPDPSLRAMPIPPRLHELYGETKHVEEHDETTNS